MRVGLGIVIFVVSAISGFGLSFRYKKRERFFSDFVDFLNHAKSEIGFFQNRLSSVLMSFNSTGQDFEKLAKAKANQLDGINDNCYQKPKFLSDNEWQFVDGFFSRIGKTDAETEKDNILAVLEKVVCEKNKAIEVCNTKGKACAKLGVAFGLALAIVVL